ncbi:MAG: hypothetical protein RBR42_02325 [Desulfomicrobium sp.]|nr:hypothetical protein [Desulfomicrobium sp.]
MAAENTCSHEATKSRKDKEKLSQIVVNCAYRMHVEQAVQELEAALYG